MRSNVVISCLLVLFQNVCCEEEKWVAPHAWSEHSQFLYQQQQQPGEDSCQCKIPVPTAKSLATIEDQLALTYFKKFVSNLFGAQKLQYGKTAQRYKRSLVFTLLSSQVTELEAAQDVRDLDIILTQILKEAKDLPLHSDGFENDYSYTHQGMGLLALFTEIVNDFVQLLNTSEMKFLIAVLAAFTIGWFVRKRYRFPVFVIIFGGIFLYGYFYTYLECNRKLEIDSMLEVIDNQQKPLKDTDRSWFSNIYIYVFGDGNIVQEREKLILKSTRLNIPFCRPDHVFLTYTSDILIKQIQMIVEKTWAAISNINTGLWGPFKLIPQIGLVLMVCYIIKLTFKYILSPKAWNGRTKNRSSDSVGQALPVNAQLTSGDRLSGENLKILLNVISNSSITQAQEQQQMQSLPVSGVQELLEPLEAPETETTESQIPIKQVSNENNVSSSSDDILKEAGITLVNY